MDMDEINQPLMDVFGESITLDGNTIDAIVDLTPGLRDIGGGMIIDKTDPAITVSTAVLDPLLIVDGDVAVIRGSNYRVLNILPDDNGMTTITLRPV